jgi:hypothetical protein
MPWLRIIQPSQVKYYGRYVLSRLFVGDMAYVSRAMLHCCCYLLSLYLARCNPLPSMQQYSHWNGRVQSGDLPSRVKVESIGRSAAGFDYHQSCDRYALGMAGKLNRCAARDSRCRTVQGRWPIDATCTTVFCTWVASFDPIRLCTTSHPTGEFSVAFTVAREPGPR